MKNLIFILAVGSLLLTSCSKEESFEENNEQMNDPVYVLEQNQNSSKFSTLTLDGTHLTLTTKDTRSLGSTSGLYAPFTNNPISLSWTGFQDETGSFGNAEFRQEAPNYVMHFTMQTECVVVDGNQALYGGIITEVRALSGDVPPIDVNWRFYFQVTDNEIGSSIGADRISSTTIFASPRSKSLCTVYPPKHRIWSEGYSEVHEPGFVEVREIPE